VNEAAKNIVMMDLAILQAEAAGGMYKINRNFDQAIEVEINLHGFEFSDFLESRVMNSKDLNATNTADDPERVRAKDGPAATARDGVWCVTVPSASWSVFRFGCRPTTMRSKKI
jgi:alpha-N-arabinofuranosidase